MLYHRHSPLVLFEVRAGAGPVTAPAPDATFEVPVHPLLDTTLTFIADYPAGDIYVSSGVHLWAGERDRQSGRVHKVANLWGTAASPRPFDSAEGVYPLSRVAGAFTFSGPGCDLVGGTLDLADEDATDGYRVTLQVTHLARRGLCAPDFCRLLAGVGEPRVLGQRIWESAEGGGE